LKYKVLSEFFYFVAETIRFEDQKSVRFNLPLCS